MSVADKLLPSFYVIEIEGKALQSVIPGEYGIEKISVGSRDFENDLFALAALSNAMSYIIANPDVDQSQATEKIDYNPEFFPLMKSAELSPEKKEKQRADEEEAAEMTQVIQQTQVAITREFDPLGDFVESRWKIDAPTFSVLGRVAVNPDRYLRQKAIDLPDRSRPIQPKPQQVSLH
jgi:hypothetical protein